MVIRTIGMTRYLTPTFRPFRCRSLRLGIRGDVEILDARDARREHYARFVVELVQFLDAFLVTHD